MLISHHFHKMSLKRNKAVYINDYCINIFQILYNHVCRFIQKMHFLVYTVIVKFPFGKLFVFQ